MACGINPADADAALAQQHRAIGRLAHRALAYCQRCATDLKGLRGDQQFVVQMGRVKVAQLRVTDNKDPTRGLTQPGLADAARAQPFGSGALKELEVASKRAQ